MRADPALRNANGDDVPLNAIDDDTYGLNLNTGNSRLD
jgi:hypothetical protein